MKLTREEALKLHRQMWTDMLAELGEKGVGKYDVSFAEDKLLVARNMFKADWCKKHFPGDGICDYCFLCEYALQKEREGSVGHKCDACPIMWSPKHITFACERTDGVTWNKSPISEILALPERRQTDEVCD